MVLMFYRSRFDAKSAFLLTYHPSSMFLTAMVENNQ